MSSFDNQINNIRPGSTFDSFEPHTDSQRDAAEKLAKLAASIVAKESEFRKEFPFDAARFVFVSGRPGRGKTHLVEAFLNQILSGAPSVAKRTWLTRGNFTGVVCTSTGNLSRHPVIVFDDVYCDKNSIGAIDGFDIRNFMDLTMLAYDRRALVMMTSNFPLKAGLLEIVAKVDKVGRVVSRLREMISMSGELVIEGPDYREIISASGTHDVFSV